MYNLMSNWPLSSSTNCCVLLIRDTKLAGIPGVTAQSQEDTLGHCTNSHTHTLGHLEPPIYLMCMSLACKR